MVNSELEKKKKKKKAEQVWKPISQPHICAYI